MKYSAQRVEQVLSLVEQGVCASEICRQCDITDTTFYTWKKLYQGLNAAGIELHRQLSQHNRDLNKQVETLQQDKAALQSVIDAQLNTEGKEQQIHPLLNQHPITQHHARKLLQLS